MMLLFFLCYALAVIVPPSNELFDIKTYSLEDFFQEFEMHRVMPGLQHGKLVPRNTGGAIWKVWFGNQTHYILGVPTLSKDFCERKDFLETVSQSIGSLSFVFSEENESPCQTAVAQHFSAQGVIHRHLSPSNRKSLLHKYHQDTIQVIYKRDSRESYQFMKATHQRKVAFQKLQTELYKLGDLFGVTVLNWCALWAEFGRTYALNLYKELYSDRNKQWATEVTESNLEGSALVVVDWDGILGWGGIVESFRRANFSPKQIPIEGFYEHGEDVELLRLAGIDHARFMEKVWLIRVGRYAEDMIKKHEEAEAKIKQQKENHIAELNTENDQTENNGCGAGTCEVDENETQTEGTCSADSGTCEPNASDKEEL